jgi:hypothetical protein
MSALTVMLAALVTFGLALGPSWAYLYLYPRFAVGPLHRTYPLTEVSVGGWVGGMGLSALIAWGFTANAALRLGWWIGAGAAVALGLLVAAWWAIDEYLSLRNR